VNLTTTLSEAELEGIFNQVWKEEFRAGRRDFDFCRYAFRAWLVAGEKDLERRGLLDLFHRTQRLPDYPRAEDAIKRGWANWAKQEFRMGGPNEAKDYQAMHQRFLLWGVRHDSTVEARRERIQRSSKLLDWSRGEGDKEFFRKLRHDRAEPPCKREGHRDFIQVLLTRWLTAFWWLMPLKLVAYDMARAEGKANDAGAVNSRYQNLRQITTRRKPPVPGVYFSAGYNGVFYSTKPSLIKDIHPDGSPVLKHCSLLSR
jgi:hypothetical protein